LAKILIIEDDPNNLQIMVRFLSRSKFEPLVAESGEHALRLARAERPQAVLMDLKLDQWDPPSNGLELTREIRKFPEADGVPIIAVSARGLEHERQEAIDAGCTEVVVKPVDYLSLMQKLQALTSG
jgi:DNA-binding response OmpR family regulator